MNQLNSRMPIVSGGLPTYLTSEPFESSEYWGQPPVSHYNVEFRENVLHGEFVNVVCIPFEIESVSQEILDPKLREELEAWEMASDEALKNF